MSRIVFFAPHSALWVHTFPEALVAESLVQGGHEVYYVGCGGTLQDYCIAMSAQGLTPTSPKAEKLNVCKRCKGLRNLVVSNFGFPAIDIAELIREEDKAAVRKMLEAVNQRNYQDFMHCGVPAGSVALYEFILHQKKVSLEFTDEDWSAYLIALSNTLLTLTALNRFFDREKFDSIVVYNALYSVNRAACLLAEARGMRAVFLHAGGNLSNRLQTLMVHSGNAFDFLLGLKNRWSEYSAKPCPPKVARLVTDHFCELIRGQHFLAYSAAKGGTGGHIRQRFGIPVKSKLLIATMSSYDERLAGEAVGAIGISDNLLFPRQVDWIQTLVGFVRNRPNLFLLIRVHPRELPNKRDRMKSEHATQLEEIFDRLPDNAKVNWPTDQLSLYDLAEEADVFLSAWSAVGKEMSLLGLPVVIYSRELVLYPPDLNFVAENLDGYLRKIDEAIIAGWSLERARMAYRWYALEYCYSLVDISESFSRQEARSRTVGARILGRLCRIIDTYHQERAEIVARATALRSAELIEEIVLRKDFSNLDSRNGMATEGTTEFQEKRAIAAELGRLARVMGTSEAAAGGGRLTKRLAGLAAELEGVTF